MAGDHVMCNSLDVCAGPPHPWLSPSLSPQNRGVVSSRAYQPSLGNRLQVLGVQQGGVRPLCVLPAAAPVQKDVHGHHQQAAEAEPLKRIRTDGPVGEPVGEPGQQLTDSRVTERLWWNRRLWGKLTHCFSRWGQMLFSFYSCPRLHEIALTWQKTKKKKGAKSHRRQGQTAGETERFCSEQQIRAAARTRNRRVHVHLGGTDAPTRGRF